MQFIKYARRYRYVSLVLLLCILASSVAAYGSGLKLYVPYVTNTTDISNMIPDMLRVDNIALWDLDARLLAWGVQDSAERAWIYDQEVARRNAGGTSSSEPDAYPGPVAPNTAPEALTGNVTGCFRGQGCSVAFTASGSIATRWIESTFGPTAFSPIAICPAGKICALVARIRATNLLPLAQQALWWRIEYATSVGFPKMLGKRCFVAA